MDKQISIIDDAIAIIGVGCKLPGETSDIERLWDIVSNKIDVITDMDNNRFPNIDNLVNNNRANGKIVTKRGGFIKDIEYFDANFFQISPKEADKLDPQQRFLLETSFNAVEDAGIPLEKLYGSKTGVFIGCWLNDFEQRLAQTPHDVDVYSTTGSGRYPLSGRLSFFYNLQGPSITIDTACSSSLVAIHLAIQSLKSGESNLAFAGAANAIVDSFISKGYSRSGLLSEYGACHFGSANPDGYVRSEGGAVIILKRLSDAINDGNQIYAVIPASVCNNDGASDKYMLAPSAITQQIMLEEAYSKAHIDVNKVKYIEAHGTGTKAGDPAEITSIWKALSTNRKEGNNIFIGSVKTNIGHTEGVAGFAGLFKVLMAMKHKTIPPNLHFYEPNPEIDWQNMNVVLPTESVAWETETNEPLVAGVNAFGITGTNAHVIVQSFENTSSEKKILDKKYNILPISANNSEAVINYAKLYQSNINEDNYLNFTKNIAFHKANLQQRNAIVFSDFQDFQLGLKAIVDKTNNDQLFSGYSTTKLPKIAFVFPGQGSQWLGMGKELYRQEIVFKNAIDDCESAFKNYVDWNLTDILFSDDTESLSEIDIIQPTLVAIEIALAKLWMSIGVQPNAAVGHSMGEIAAAYIAGIISLDNAANIICTRSQLMKEQKGKGAMGYVALAVDELKPFLESSIDNVNIGVVNSPKSTVITGDKTEVERIISTLDEQGFFSRLIKVDVASHSQQMDILKPRLLDATQNIQAKESEIIFQSTVHPEIQNAKQIQADYWVDNLRNTVQFSEAIQQLIDEGIEIFIEISPNPVLNSAIQENIDIKKSEAIVLFSLEKNKNDILSFTEQIAKAFCNGVFIDWKNFYGNQYEKIKLPPYPWQREYHWIKEIQTSSVYNQDRKVNNGLPHPFLKNYAFSQGNITTHIWETILSLEEFTYLSEHKVGDRIIFPAAGFIEIIQACCTEVKPEQQFQIEHLCILESLELSQEEAINLKITLQQAIGNFYSLKINSIKEDEVLQHLSTDIIFKPLVYKNSDKVAELAQAISKETHYSACRISNLNYGNGFQGIQKIHHNESVFEATIELPDNINIADYIIHPTLLDACLQTILAPIYLKNDATYVPFSISQYKFYKAPKTSKLKSKVEVYDFDKTKLVCNLWIYEADDLCVEAVGVEFRVIHQAKSEASADNLFYELESTKIPIQNSSSNDAVVLLGNLKNKEIIAQAFGETRPVSFIEIQSYSKAILKQIFKQIEFAPNTQLVFCVDENLEWDKEDGIFSFQQRNIIGITEVVQAVVELNLEVRLWCITKGAIAVTQQEVVSPLQHQIPAFVRILWNENFELKPSVIDIEKSEDLLLLPNLLNQDNNENEIAIRDGQFYATRLSHKLIAQQHKSKVISKNIPFRYEMEQVGLIDNLVANAYDFSAPSANEALIEIKSVGVNFMSLLSVLGICPSGKNGFCTLGIECVGIVQAIGENVHHILVGDVVYGMAYDTLASHTKVNANALCKVPQGYSYDELATIPAVFLTVYYSLIELARIKKGDKVLIHAATGGVGLAAIQLCKLYECEIYATAGSEEKRTYLKSIGVVNVYNSRTVDFFDEILKDTDGKGVDVVLNSLVGEAMYKSLQLLNNFGRFIEIGKKDIFENSKIGMEVFRKSLSYFMVDAEKLLFEKPELLGELLHEISALFEEKQLEPLPFNVFNIAQAKEAFRLINTSKHIGKIVINIEHQEDLEIHKNSEFTIDEKATYLLTGGLGGLGLQFTKMLVEQGAKNIILLGRKAPSSEIESILENYRNVGVNIITYQADVSNKRHLQIVFNNIPVENPLKGVFHLAGLLDDASIINLTEDKFYNVLLPKVFGALYLHELTKNIDLDYFVLFSSSAVLFASPGQSAYVAANAYLDGLAQQRKAEKLAALSIQWSTVADVGLAAVSENRSERLKAEGIEPLLAEDCTNLFQDIANIEDANIGIFKFDVQKWQQNYSTAKNNPYFSLLTDSKDDKTTTVLSNYIDELKLINDKTELEHQIEQKIKETLAKVTKISIDKISTRSTFKSLGIDSLMSIQLKNQLEQIFEIKLSVTAFWTHATIKAYAKFLIDKLNFDKENSFEETEHRIQKSVVTSNEIETPKSQDVIIAQLSIDDNEPTTANEQQPTILNQSNNEEELEDLSKLLDDELKDLL